MKRTGAYSVFIMAGLIIGGITVSVVLLVNRAVLGTECAVFAPFGWTMLATSLIVLVLAGRALARQRRFQAPDAPRAVERRTCGGCGHEVHGGWRMCPYCGSLVDGSRVADPNEV